MASKDDQVIDVSLFCPRSTIAKSILYCPANNKRNLQCRLMAEELYIDEEILNSHSGCIRMEVFSTVFAKIFFSINGCEIKFNF